MCSQKPAQAPARLWHRQPHSEDLLCAGLAPGTRLSPTGGGGCHSPYFPDEETEAPRARFLPEATEQGDKLSSARLQPRVGSRTWKESLCLPSKNGRIMVSARGRHPAAGLGGQWWWWEHVRKFLERCTGSAFAKTKRNSFRSRGPQILCPPTPGTSHPEWGYLSVCLSPHQIRGPRAGTPMLFSAPPSAWHLVSTQQGLTDGQTSVSSV